MTDLTHDAIEDLRRKLEVDSDDLTDAQVTALLTALDLAEEALNIRPPVDGADLLDRRQRRAAAIILCAVDLPCEMVAWARQIGGAVMLQPGLTTADITLGSRDAGLRQARALLDDMLGETPA